jgi:hypothetical protein
MTAATTHKVTYFGVMDQVKNEDRLVRSDGAFVTLEFKTLVLRLARHGIKVTPEYRGTEIVEFAITPENDVQEYYLARMVTEPISR